MLGPNSWRSMRKQRAIQRGRSTGGAWPVKPAIAAGAFDEALRHLDAAETLLDVLDDPDAAARTAAGIAVLRALGSLVSRGYSHPNTVALYDRAEGLARMTDDSLVLLTASYGVWAGHHTGEKVAPGLDTSERMLAEAALRADDRLEMMGHRLRATSLTVSGRLDEALPEFEMTHTLYDPVRHQALSRTTGTDHSIGMRCYQAIALLALGRTDAAQDLVREAQDISATQNSVNVRAYTLYPLRASRSDGPACRRGDRACRATGGAVRERRSPVLGPPRAGSVRPRSSGAGS